MKLLQFIFAVALIVIGILLFLRIYQSPLIVPFQLPYKNTLLIRIMISCSYQEGETYYLIHNYLYYCDFCYIYGRIGYSYSQLSPSYSLICFKS
jgi:hypothetical protein